MKFIDFFAGIGGMRAGLEKAGHTCVGWCEFDKYSQISYRALYNPDERGEWFSNDIRKVESAELIELNQKEKEKDGQGVECWSFGFPCFAEDTYILTDRGYIPIQNINIGGLVLTHKGNWKKVTNVMKRENAELWQVKGFGILPTTTTENHPYYVADADGKYEFIKVQKLNHEHWTTLILPTEQDDEHTEEWYRLAGRYVADGWRVRHKNKPRGGRIVIACNDEKSAVLEDMIKKAGYHYTKSKERTCNKYIICNNELYYDLRMFGKYAWGKRIPRNVLEAPIHKAKAFFDGYMSGDGCKDEIRATTVSPALVLGMAMIAWKIGYSFPSITVTERPKTCVIEGRTCNQRTTYSFKCAKTKGVKSKNGNDGYVLRKMELPKKTGEKGTVYNISVEEDESYIANGAIVHNCQDISVAGKQKSFSGERSVLFFEIIRLLQGIPQEDRPRWLIAENVRNLLSIGRGWDFARCIVEMEKCGYDVQYQLFNTKHSYVTNEIRTGQDGKQYIGYAVRNGIPQNRERVFIVAEHTGKRGRRKVLPVATADGEDIVQLSCIGSVGQMHQATAIYDGNGLARTLQAECGGLGAKTGLYTMPGEMQTIPVGNRNPCGHGIGGAIYSEKGLSPTVHCNGKSCIHIATETKSDIVTHIIPQTVTVRKNEVDINGLQLLLRTHKDKAGLTNKAIAEALDVPLTKVEHWFRTDKCFAIPTTEDWFRLKEILGITTEEFDKQVTEFVELENKFDQLNRVYGTEGVAPTLTCTNTDVKILENPIIFGSLQEHAAVKTDGVCTTLTEAMGAGGGNIPCVVEKTKKKDNEETDVSDSMETDKS